MLSDDELKRLSIYGHVQAVAMSLHYFKLKLRDLIQNSTEPDDRMANVIRMVAKDLADSKAEIDRNVIKLEKHFATLKKTMN